MSDKKEIHQVLTLPKLSFHRLQKGSLSTKHSKQDSLQILYNTHIDQRYHKDHQDIVTNHFPKKLVSKQASLQTQTSQLESSLTSYVVQSQTKNLSQDIHHCEPSVIQNVSLTSPSTFIFLTELTPQQKLLQLTNQNYIDQIIIKEKIKKLSYQINQQIDIDYKIQNERFKNKKIHKKLDGKKISSLEYAHSQNKHFKRLTQDDCVTSSLKDLNLLDYKQKQIKFSQHKFLGFEQESQKNGSIEYENGCEQSSQDQAYNIFGSNIHVERQSSQQINQIHNINKNSYQTSADVKNMHLLFNYQQLRRIQKMRERNLEKLFIDEGQLDAQKQQNKIAILSEKSKILQKMRSASNMILLDIVKKNGEIEQIVNKFGNNLN